MVRLANLLGADDPEDIAQEAFARLIRKHGALRDPEAALAYVRASVCNLTRNRNRHLRVVRLRTLSAHHEDSSEQVVMVRDDHREVLAALAKLPPRRREAIVLRYWLDLSEREIAASRPSSGGIAVFHYPAGTLDAKSGWMTAYLLRDGRVGFWSSDNADPALSSGPASGPPTVGTLGGGYAAGAKVAEFYGYAHQNVARVVLRLGNGRQYSAQTFAAWPGSGLRLWDFSVPTNLLRVKPDQDVMMGYNAAGQIVWQLRANGSAAGFS